MTKNRIPKLTAAALAFALLPFAGGANAQEGYLSSAYGPVVTTAYGICVKTPYWNPAEAVAPCDVLPVAQVPAPVPVVVAQPAPAPQPAPAVVAQAPIIEKVALDADVLFEFDRAVLRPQGRAELDKLADRIKDAEIESILTVGYADPIGPEQYNQKLSQERAESVKQYLSKQRGISEERIRIEGRGETREFTEGECKGLSGQKLIACFQPNRRVDIEVRGTRTAMREGTPSAGAGATR